MKFLEWDYDNNTVTTYEREGQCKQCADCCRANIIYDIYPALKGSPAEQDWWDGKGVWHAAQHQGVRGFIRITSLEPNSGGCERLTYDNRCQKRLFHEELSVVCRDWPFSPKCIEQFPNCGHSFIVKNQKAISE